MYVWGVGLFLLFCPSPLLPIPLLEIIVVGADGELVGCWMGSKFVDEMFKSHKYLYVLSLIESAPLRQKIRRNWPGRPTDGSTAAVWRARPVWADLLTRRGGFN